MGKEVIKEMSNKLNVKKTGLTLAIVIGIVYIVCAILIAIAPTATVNVFGALFHGIDISKIAATPTLGRTILGLVEILALGYIVGWLFAVIYNKLN